jgi:hypothetical protein
MARKKRLRQVRIAGEEMVSKGISGSSPNSPYDIKRWSIRQNFRDAAFGHTGINLYQIQNIEHDLYNNPQYSTSDDHEQRSLVTPRRLEPGARAMGGR